MNKRQKKKRNKIIKERLQFFENHLIYYSRRNGKTLMQDQIMKAVLNKKHRPFTDLKKKFESLIIGVDYSNGKDYSVKVTARRSGDKIRILKTEIIQ